MQFSTRLRRTVGVLASLTLASGAIAVASPAAHADGVLSGPTNANIQQQVSYTLSSPPAGNLVLESASGQSFAYQSVGLGDPSVIFTFVTSAYAEALTLYVADQNTNVIVSNSVPLTIGGVVATTTAISAPNAATIGKAITITATVTSTGGSSYNPRGQVRITDANNAIVDNMGLTNGPGAGQSYAYFRWTPKTAGTSYFIATFLPTAGSLATGSASIQDSVITTPNGNTISLAAPPTMTLNAPVVLTATVYPAGTQGSVGFTANGSAISASVPIQNGTASFTWTPNIAGKVTMGADYTTNSGGSGSTTDVVTVGASTNVDVITLVQPGWGAWGNTGTYPMGNGSSFTFQASTLSGAGVTLSETGPCTASGLTLTVNAGAGVCNMKASTPGGNGYQGVTYSYSINLVPGTQTATLSAPVSGRYKVKRVLRLESATQQDTNAGQNISWKLKKKGRANCKIIYLNSGAVNLRIVKKGTCTVLGRAPAIAGSWLKFQTARKYTGR